LILCGLQDITAHVDFTLLAESGVAAGFELAGFTHQAAFLLACGIEDYITTHLQKNSAFREGHALKRLLLPAEMGEAVKVMAFTKNLCLPLTGFSLHDRRHQL